MTRPAAALAVLALTLTPTAVDPDTPYMRIGNPWSSTPAATAPRTPPVDAETLLPWKPPPCGDATHECIDIQLSNTGANQYLTFESDHDYRIHLPPQ